MNKIFKVGLIGCGHISETYFRSQDYFNNINITVCADLNIETAKKCAKEYNIVSEFFNDENSKFEHIKIINQDITDTFIYHLFGNCQKQSKAIRNR